MVCVLCVYSVCIACVVCIVCVQCVCQSLSLKGSWLCSGLLFCVLSKAVFLLSWTHPNVSDASLDSNPSFLRQSVITLTTRGARSYEI